MYFWQIFKKVHTAFKPIVGKLAELTGTTPEWINSHGRAPDTFNTIGTGKDNPQVRDYLKLLALYEHAAKGAGVMLSRELDLLIRCQYTDCETELNQPHTVNRLLKESTEAIVKLNSGELCEKNLFEIEEIRDEAAQALEEFRSVVESLDQMIKRERQKREIHSDVFAGMKGHSAAR